MAKSADVLAAVASLASVVNDLAAQVRDVKAKASAPTVTSAAPSWIEDHKAPPVAVALAKAKAKRNNVTYVLSCTTFYPERDGKPTGEAIPGIYSTKHIDGKPVQYGKKVIRKFLTYAEYDAVRTQPDPRTR